MEFMFVIIILIIIILLASIKQVNEYEKGVLFSFGKFTRILDAGWHWSFYQFFNLFKGRR